MNDEKEITESGYVRKSKRRFGKDKEKKAKGMSEAEKLTIGQKIAERLEMHFDEDDAKTRFQYYPRWREISDMPDGSIDYDNPIVALEWVLCDRRILDRLGKGQVEEALAMFPNDEMRRQYLECKDDYGHSYRDKLENRSRMADMKAAAHYARVLRKGERVG